MSYNIDTWKTKKIENLNIPLNAFFKHERTDWHPEQPTVIDAETMEVEMECGCEQLVKGFLKNGVINVTEFKMYGEGSGTFKSWILDEALKESTGELEAVLVWEGGDSITRLKVMNGELSEIEVEL